VAIRRAAALLALALAGCPPYRVHPSFGEAYRAASAVAIVPPSVTIWAMTGGGGRSSREDWSGTVYQGLTEALRAAFEKRGLEVAWVEDTPGTHALLEEVQGRFTILLPGLVAASSDPQGFEFRQPAFEFSLGDVGLLLDTAGADLLVLAEVSGDVLTGEGVAVDLLLSFLGGSGPGDEALEVRIALADRSGRLIFFGRSDASASPLVPANVLRAVDGALSAIPKHP
jgi:hypothetical protein